MSTVPIPDTAPELSRDELQVLIEELRASNNRLSSTNRELNYANTQLRDKIAVLETQSDVLSAGTVITMFLDASLHVRWFTPAIDELFPLGPMDAGRLITDFAPKFNEPEFLDQVGEVMKTGRPAETEVCTMENGRWYMERIRPFRGLNDTAPSGVSIHFTDITDRKRAEEAQRQSEQRYRTILETDTVGVLFFNFDGVLIDANDVFLGMTGWTREEVTSGSLHWQQMTPPEWLAASEEQMVRLGTTGRIGPYEKEYYRKDGSRSWMLFAGRDLGNGVVVEYAIDINDRIRAAQVLWDSAANLPRNHTWITAQNRNRRRRGHGISRWRHR